MDKKKKYKVELQPLPSGKTKVSVSMPFVALGPEVGETDEKMAIPGLLHEKATPARRKIAAAKWFHAQLRRCIRNEISALMFLESVLISLRSATFVLQKMYAHNQGFNKWYQAKTAIMKQDKILRWLIEMRNIAEKQGLIFKEYGPHAIVRCHKEGLIEAIVAEPTILLQGIDAPDILPMIEPAIRKLESIVEEAHSLFVHDGKHTKHVFRIEYVKEIEDGVWEHFDPK